MKKEPYFRRAYIYTLIIVTFFFLGCSPLFYYSKPVYSYVVDEKSGAPIKDVIVVAFWRLDGGLEGGINEGLVHVVETVTDEKGFFYIKEWGPVGLPQGSWGRLKKDAPIIILYKEGYRTNFVDNKKNAKPFFFPLESDWSGREIRMTNFSGNLSDYNKMKRNLGELILHITDSVNTQCEWVDFPKLILSRKMEKPDDQYYLKIVNSNFDLIFEDNDCDFDDFLLRFNNEHK